MAKAPGLTRLAGMVGGLGGLDTGAGALADRLADAVESFNTERAITSGIVTTVETTRDALRQINQALLPGDNGAPGPLPVSATPPAASPSPLAAVPQAPTQAVAASPPAAAEPHFDRTALGMIRR